MKYTTNYSLNMPESTEYYNVTDFNENAEKIDSALKGLSDAVDNLDSGVSDEATARAEADTALQDTVNDLKSEVEEGYLPLAGGTITDDSGNTVEITGGGIEGTNGETEIKNFYSVEAEKGSFSSVTLASDPTGDMQAATKQYVDNAVPTVKTASNYLYIGSLLIQWGTIVGEGSTASSYLLALPISYDSADDITNVQVTLTGASSTNESNPFTMEDFPITLIGASTLAIDGTFYVTGTKLNGTTGTRSGNEALHWLVVGNAPASE